jgi:hypothetical protein
LEQSNRYSLHNKRLLLAIAVDVLSQHPLSLFKDVELLVVVEAGAVDPEDRVQTLEVLILLQHFRLVEHQVPQFAGHLILKQSLEIKFLGHT